MTAYCVEDCRCRDLETGVRSDKCPTCLLLRPDGSFESFGSAAREAFHRLEPDIASQWYYFQDFKTNLLLNEVRTRLYTHFYCVSGEFFFMALQASLNRTQIAATNNGKRFPAVDIFAHCLRSLREMALDDVNGGGIEGMFSSSDCRWVLTIPSAWRQGTKQLFREACYKVMSIRWHSSSGDY